MASQRISRLVKILTGAVADADEIFQLEGRLERFVHFWALVIRQFVHYRCFVRASALSFSTLLALIPLLAVALSVTSSMLSPQQEAKLARFVEKTVSSVAPPVAIATNSPARTPAATAPDAANFTAATNSAAANAAATNAAAGVPDGTGSAMASESAPGNPPAAQPEAGLNMQNQVAAEIHDLVQKASNRTLGSIGLLFFVFTAISLLRGIEETFNDMWGVTRGRNWWLQFMLYWCLLTVGPLLISTTLGFAGGNHLDQTRELLESSPLLAPVYKHVLPIAILSVALGLFYKLTPNTRVEPGAAMIGGLCAGAAWHFYNQLGFLLLSRALTASKYYGGLALVVLVMGGLYVLWLIILFGAQIAYAYQNRVAYLQDRLAENVNQRGREFVALRIMTAIACRYQNGRAAASVPEISIELGVPSRLTQSVLRTLAATRLVTEVAGAEAAFVPARPLEAITAHDILVAMRTGAGQELPMPDAPELAGIYGEFARIEAAERTAAAQVSLFDLANRPPSRAALTESKPAEPGGVTLPQPVAGETGAAKSTELPQSAPPPTKAAMPEPEREPVCEAVSKAVLDSMPELMPELMPEAEPARRESARPDEDRDFPL